MECAICLKTENKITEKNDVTLLHCNHTFCKDCIVNWKKGTCPTCRVRFDIDQERYVEEYTGEQVKLYDKLLAQLLFCLLQNIQQTFGYRIQKQYATENEKEVMEMVSGLTMSKLVNCYRNAQKKRVRLFNLSKQNFNTETKISLIHEQRSANREKQLKLINYTSPLITAVRNAINHLRCTEFSL